jgi:hypothetical protein
MVVHRRYKKLTGDAIEVLVRFVNKLVDVTFLADTPHRNI